MRFDIRAEALFFISIIFLIFVLFYYTRILNRLLSLLGKPRFLSLLPLFSAILFLLVLISHGIKMLYLFPLLSVSGLNLYNLLLLSFKITFLENLLFLIAGFFVFLTSIIYFAWLR